MSSYTVALALDPPPTTSEREHLAAVDGFAFDPEHGDLTLLVTVEARERLAAEADATALAEQHGAHVIGYIPPHADEPMPADRA